MYVNLLQYIHCAQHDIVWAFVLIMNFDFFKLHDRSNGTGTITRYDIYLKFIANLCVIQNVVLLWTVILRNLTALLHGSTPTYVPQSVLTHWGRDKMDAISHDDVIKWEHFPRNWPFVRGIHRSPVNSPHKGQWRGAFMFSLICVWINGWVNNRKAGDLIRYRAHYDVIVMADDVFKCILLNENVWITTKNSLKYVPKGPINNILALVQIMAWRRPGDKPLPEPMLVSLPDAYMRHSASMS